MKRNKLITLLFSIYTGAIIIQNILATKQIDIFVFTVTTGILISPIVFIVQDIVSELFGYKVAKKMILTGFAMNFVGVLFFALAIHLPSSLYWQNQEAFEIILGTTARITIASFTAYIIGSLMNAKVMVDMKNANNNPLFVRAIASTIIGQTLDNAVFSFVAFAFVLPVNAIMSMIIGATIFETLYEVVFFPITKSAITILDNYLKEDEQ